MDPAQWASERDALSAKAKTGWQQLVTTFRSLGARIDFVPPVAGLPDLVFTANAAVVLNRIALVAQFRHTQRQGETAHFEAFFRGLVTSGVIDRVEMMPDGICLEGAGDCVWDQTRQCFWLGHGPRSDLAAAEIVARTFGQRVIPLELVNPRFYHMDTALCPLSGGDILVVKSAFSPDGLARITEIVGAHNIIFVPDIDSARLSANAVCLGRDIVLCDCTAELEAALNHRGYRVHRVALEPFALSGGSAFCLTLAVDRRSIDVAQAA
jgi:N-dimethylarginine dimethylaminohydrolase